MQILKQSTAVDVLIGPFVDSTDGYTAETAVSPSVKLSKNGQALAAKNDVTTPVHDADGYYNCEFDATDTNTVGTLVLSVVGSATSLPVRHEFQVVEEDVYDTLFASAGALTNLDVNAVQISGDSVAADNAEAFFDGTGYAGTNNVIPTVTNVTNQVTADMTAISGDTVAADNLELDYDGTGYNKSNSTIGTCTTNTDMRGTDSALLAANVPTNFTDLAITVTTGLVSVGTNNDKTGYSISGTKTTLDALNDVSAADVNAQCDTALTDYDAPTKAEMDAGFAALNDVSAADVNTQVDTALADIHLDHLFATTYNASAHPGDSAALLNALVEDNSSGTPLFTTEALENSPSGGSAPTTAQIADAVWEEAIADHSGTAGSTAEALNAAGSAGDPWTTALPGSYSAGQAGNIVGNNLNAPIDTVDTVVEAIKAVTDNLPDSGALTSLAQASALATVDTNVDAVLVDTGTTIPAQITAQNDLSQAEVRTALGLATANLDTQLDALPTAAENRTEMDSNSTQLSAIVTDTGTTLPGQISGLNDVSAADVNAQCDIALADYDAPTKAELDSGFAALNDPTAASIADAVWDEVLSGHVTTGTTGKAVTDMESGIITGTAQTGTLSTTQSSTDLSGYADDQLIGAVIVWLTGSCAGERTDITNYANTSGVLTFTALTTAPSNGDTFKIV